eukprot:1356243-Amorphochlora_amoeboformis.AAC.1
MAKEVKIKNEEYLSANTETLTIDLLDRFVKGFCETRTYSACLSPRAIDSAEIVGLLCWELPVRVRVRVR